MAIDRFFTFKRWGDLRDWVFHHEALFKMRSFNRSTAKDFEFAKSKWDQFYKLIKKGKLKFELKVYAKVKVGPGDVNWIPKEVRFITVIVEEAGKHKEHSLYNKRAWKEYVRSSVFEKLQHAREFEERVQQIVNDDWDSQDG